MNGTNPSAPAPPRVWYRHLAVPGALLILILLILAGTWWYRRSLEHSWTGIRQTEETKLIADFQGRFLQFELGISASLDSLRSLPSLERVFTTDDDSLQEAYFFNGVLPQLNSDLAIEVYDQDRHLIGWNGPRGPSFPLSRLGTRTARFIADDQIYSYLIVAQPVILGRTLVGYLVGKRLLNVNYPLNNRFINKQTLQSSFQTRITDQVDYDFSSKAAPATDSQTVSVRLTGPDSEKLGYAYLHRDDLDSRVQQVTAWGEQCAALAGAAGWIWLIAVIIRSRSGETPRFSRAAAGVAAVWLFRYYLILCDLPQASFRFDILDPRIYASGFGWGLARSAADLLLTSLALLTTVIVVARTHPADYLLRGFPPRAEGGGRGAAVVTAFLTAFVISLSLRAYMAILVSAVDDSGISYNEAGFLLPGFAALVMLVTLFLITLIFLYSLYGIARLAGRFCALAFEGRARRNGLILLLLAYTAVPLLGVYAESQPLMEGWLRMLLMLALAIPGFRAAGGELRGAAVSNVRRLIPGVLGALVVFTVLLERSVERRERSQIELAAQNISQAPDGWLTVLVQKALAEMTGREAVETLTEGDAEDIEGLAFREWASSVLGREGNSCSVTYVTNAGTVTSDFHIGIPPHSASEHRIVMPAVTPSVHAEERVVNGRASLWHIGFARLYAENGDSIGGVLIELSGNRESLLTGDAPEFLRNYPGQPNQIRSQGLIYSEYYQGKLVYSTDDLVSYGRPLPEAAAAAPGGQGLWISELIGENFRDSYYYPDRARVSGNAWIALSVPQGSWGERLYAGLRLMTVIALLTLAGVMLIYLFRIRRGSPVPSLTFRQKIFVALCCVSLLPIAVLAVVNKRFAAEEMESALTARLAEQTGVVLAEVQRLLGNVTPATLVQVNDEKCAAIASVVKTDFHVYLLRSFLASSKPEIFHAGLVDPRISAPVYHAVMVQRRRLFIEHQQIGVLPYIVGYRPIFAEDGSIIGAVAVPTVYHQIEINERFTRRNSFLSALYALTFLLSLLVATVFATRIFSPIRRLTEAARQIGSGQLDIGFRRSRTDEIGELEEAFYRMAENLRKMQAEMRQRERETAWREMARQVAHEIKNPLTPMKLSLQHLRRMYSDGVRNFGTMFEEVSKTLLEQIDALTRIASEFSRFARMPERILEECSLHEVLRDAVLLHRQEHGIRFVEQYAGEDLRISADREEMRRMFINLIRNAIQAMNGNGTLTVSTARNGAEAVIDIADTGKGIAGDVLHRIFEPNFSTTSGGMGLGLPIVRKIVEDLHGTIRITSAPGRGTTVHIGLPLAAPGVTG